MTTESTAARIAELERHKGSEHVVPFASCICGTDMDVQECDGMVWLLVCPECGLQFGGPNGYSSRLDMANDWNRLRSANHTPPQEKP